MKYKTLFRVSLKLIGVWLIAQSIVDLLDCALTLWLLNPPLDSSFHARGFALTTVRSCLGLYLLFGGKWIADLAIPGNRPYCPECGYDLTGATESRCSECGTLFSSKDILPPGTK